MKVVVTYWFCHGALQRVTLGASETLRCQVVGEVAPLLRDAVVAWTESYGSNAAFPLPLDLGNISPFRQQVLKTLLAIPFGMTTTYGAVAKKVGKKGAARAVGSSCRFNPYPLVIPCHRVVPASRKVGGYAFGCDIKERLLAYEREEVASLSR